MCQDCIFHAGRLVALRRERPCLRAARHHRRAAPQDSSKPETSLPKSQVASRFTDHSAVVMIRRILFSEPRSFYLDAHAWRRIRISEKAGNPHSAAVLPVGPPACRADIQRRGFREKRRCSADIRCFHTPSSPQRLLTRRGALHLLPADAQAGKQRRQGLQGQPIAAADALAVVQQREGAGQHDPRGRLSSISLEVCRHVVFYHSRIAIGIPQTA